jgi:dTDP-4-dehydrorhamnose reductase
LNRTEVDFQCFHTLEKNIRELRPWAVVYAAGYFDIDAAEMEWEHCYTENVRIPSFLADACAKYDSALLTFSSDLVFDGATRSPYCESDHVFPLGVFGRSKAEAESEVLARHDQALIVRSGAYFGPWDDGNFLAITLRSLEKDKCFLAPDDLSVSPTYVPDLVHACLDLLIDGEHGIWHVANPGGLTWVDFARQIADRAGVPHAVKSCPAQLFGWTAPRPSYSVLSSERGLLLPPLEHALDRHFVKV